MCTYGKLLLLSVACALIATGCNESTCPECEQDISVPYPCPVSEEMLWRYDGEGDDQGRPALDTLSSLEQEVLALVNEARVEFGLCPLSIDCCLWEVARTHTREMAANTYCDHVNLSGDRVSDRLDAAGIPWMKCGEILGCQEPGDDLVETVVAAWMTSQAHRDTILNCQYTHTGIGICTDGEGLYYLTEVFAAF